jgi:hypothetical protein
MLASFTAFAYQIVDIVDMSRTVKFGRDDRFRTPSFGPVESTLESTCPMASLQNISNSHLYALTHLTCVQKFWQVKDCKQLGTVS